MPPRPPVSMIKPKSVRTAQDAAPKRSLVEFVRANPQAAAAVAKIQERPVTHAQYGNQEKPLEHLNQYLVKSLLKSRAEKNQSAKALIKLLPDLELTVQILIACILSPQDMMDPQLHFSIQEGIASARLTGEIVEAIKKYHEKENNLVADLPVILRDVLAEKGAHPVLVLPESNLDMIIGGDLKPSTESLLAYFDRDGTPKHRGLLGSPFSISENSSGKISAEGLSSVFDYATRSQMNVPQHLSLGANTTHGFDNNVVVTDNHAVLRLAKFIDRMKVGSTKAYLSQESAGYRNRGQYAAVTVIKGRDGAIRKSIGKPLVMRLPSESVLPVFTPNDKSKHVAYFIAVDEQGNPIEVGDYSDYVQQSSRTSPVQTRLVDGVSANFGVGQHQLNPQLPDHLKMITSVYSEMVERDLMARLKNGVSGTNIELSSNSGFYQLMLSRTLANKLTQLVYVPAEFMTYYALRFDDCGMGTNAMDDMSTLNTLRSVLLFSDVLSSVKNSIGIKDVTINLDADDPDPWRTLEHAQHEVMKSNTVMLPTTPGNIADITGFIQRNGYRWKIEGNEAIPNMSFEQSQTSTSYPRADSDLQEQMRDSSIMGFGISPETVNNAKGPEFATTAVHQNILLTKRVATTQREFNPLLTKHVKLLTDYDQILRDQIIEILSKRPDELLLDITIKTRGTTTEEPSDDAQKLAKYNIAVDLIIDSLKVELPKPVSVTFENQKEEFTAYCEALDEALNYICSDDVFNKSIAGEEGSSEGGTLKAMYKAHLVRQWMLDNNYLTELSRIGAVPDEASGIADLEREIVDYSKKAVSSATKLLASLKEAADSMTSDMSKVGLTPGDISSSNDSSSSSDSDDDFSFGADDFSDMGSDTQTDNSDNPEDVESTETDTNKDTPPEEDQETNPT